MGRSAPPQVTALTLPGRLAELLAGDGEEALTEALEMLVADLDLRSAVLRETDTLGSDGHQPSGGHLAGPLLAVAGEAVHAVPPMRAGGAGAGAEESVELPIRAGGRDVAILTATGAQPSQLAMLRAAAAVLGLALLRGGSSRGGLEDDAAALAAAADGEADDAADRLHDGPVQALVVAHYAAGVAVRGGDPGLAREAVHGALVELRRWMWHLRPRGRTTDGGLAGALSMLSGRLEEADLPPLGLAIDELAAAGMPAEVASVAYRLVQAVALVADAPVRVALRRVGTTAVLAIDDGPPLPAADRWASKARALGCTLTTTSGGTRLVVPLSATPSSPWTKATP